MHHRGPTYPKQEMTQRMLLEENQPQPWGPLVAPCDQSPLHVTDPMGFIPIQVEIEIKQKVYSEVIKLDGHISS